MVKIISVDLANKSLAISIIDYNLDYINDIKLICDAYLETKKIYMTILQKQKQTQTEIQKQLQNLINAYNLMIDGIMNVMNTKIKIELLTVVDLIPGEKVSDTDIIYRSRKLHKYLNLTLDPIIANLGVPNSDLLFLLEYQMNANIKSNAVANQIIYHFSKYSTDIENIKLIGPSLKNKVAVGDHTSHYSNFVEKYKTLYASNKNHAKHNFLKLLDFLDKREMIKNIPKKNIDDIADSVIMSLAYVLKLQRQ